MRANVEAALIAYLRSQGFEAFADVPDGERVGRPTRFAVVERTGGGHDPFVDRPTVTVSCHAATRYLASELAYEVDSAMKGFEACSGVRHVAKRSIANYSDAMEGVAGMYRCTYSIATFDDEQ